MSRPAYIYGEILSSDIYAAAENEPPGIVRFLSQGAAVGAFFGFLAPVNGMLSHPENGYNYLLMLFLPDFVLRGIGFGVVEGIMIWGCTYTFGHRLIVALRAGLGIVVFAMLLYVYVVLIEPSPHPNDESGMDYFLIRVVIVCGMLYGLVIGSRLHPLHELIRGIPDSNYTVMCAITGFALRIVVILGLMYSVLYLIWAQQGVFSRQDFTFAAIGISHFLLGGLILFARMPFWLLLPLAVIVNFPIAVAVTDVLTEKDVSVRAITLNYLVLWAAFLSCRVSLPHAKRER